MRGTSLEHYLGNGVQGEMERNEAKNRDASQETVSVLLYSVMKIMNGNIAMREERVNLTSISKT